jgi:hypothetical protein
VIDLAAIRPDEWNLPLFLHILGALTMIGALTLAASFLVQARRAGGSIALTRYGFRSLLWFALPSFLVMRIAAQWLIDEEGLQDAEAAWIDLGFISTDIGFLFLATATVATGMIVRRAGGADAAAGGAWVSVATWLVGILLVVYAVVIWAMATKPT